MHRIWEFFFAAEREKNERVRPLLHLHTDPSSSSNHHLVQSKMSHSRGGVWSLDVDEVGKSLEEWRKHEMVAALKGRREETEALREQLRRAEESRRQAVGKWEVAEREWSEVSLLSHDCF